MPFYSWPVGRVAYYQDVHSDYAVGVFASLSIFRWYSFFMHTSCIVKINNHKILMTSYLIPHRVRILQCLLLAQSGHLYYAMYAISVSRGHTGRYRARIVVEK